jgi:hypothetical protein
MSTPKQLALPFTTQSENRKEPFSSEEEVAAVFALAELERKNGGITSKQEKINYITKVGYPFWFIVQESVTYVFDGLDKLPQNCSYYEAPQTEPMIKDFETYFRIREEYTKFLVSYQNSFEQALIKKDLACEGLVTDNETLNQIDSYRKEATEIYEQTFKPSLLSPVLKETEASAVVDQIEKLKATFMKETEKLEQLSGLISKTTKEYIEGLHFESKAVTEETEAKIKAQKEIINPKIEKLTNEHGKQIERLEKNIDREIQPLKKQKSQIEKSIVEAETKLESYNKQSKTEKVKSNKSSEESLKKKIKREKQELDEFKKQLKKVEKQLKALTEEKADEMSRLKREFDKKLQIERQPILELEMVRDKKLETFNQEIVELEELSKSLLDELDNFVIKRQNIMSRAPPVSLKSDSKLKSNALLHVPFYIAAYEGANSESKRYLVFSPSVVNSLGFSAKLKGAFGRAKIKALLDSRFKAVSSLGEKIRLKASSSSEFSEQIEAYAKTNNVLTAETLLENGLVLLRDEGWFSDSEYQSFISAVKHTL